MPGQGWNPLQKPPKPNKETIELSIYRKSEQVTRHPKRICVHENILHSNFSIGMQAKVNSSLVRTGMPRTAFKGYDFVPLGENIPAMYGFT